MKPVTYTIKTHNPILLIAIGLVTVASSTWLLKDLDDGTGMIIFVLILFGVLALCNYFLGSNIKITMTEKGIATNWAKLPFFIKSYEEILWTDIITWNFRSWRMADTFYIKTKEKQQLYIRCLDFFKRQKNLDEFIQTFQEYYSQTKRPGDEINNNDRVFMQKPIGRVFAFAYLTIVTVGIYIVFIKNKTPVTSIDGLKAIFIFAVLLFFVGAAIYFYFKDKGKRSAG